MCDIPLTRVYIGFCINIGANFNVVMSLYNRSPDVHALMYSFKFCQTDIIYWITVSQIYIK